MRKIDLFFRYLSVFLLLAFCLSMFVPTYYRFVDPFSFCYEVVPDDELFYFDGVLVYDNSTGCVVVSYEEYKIVKKNYFLPKIFSFIGLLGWFTCNPDFRKRLKEKLKTFNQ